MPVNVVDSTGKSPTNTSLTLSLGSMNSRFAKNIPNVQNMANAQNMPSNSNIPKYPRGISMSTDCGRNLNTLDRNTTDYNQLSMPPRFSNTNNSSILELVTIHKKMKDTPEFIKEINAGLESDKNALKMIESGEGGVYLIHNEEGKMIAIFKPQDEDPFSPNNPKMREHHPDSTSPNAKQGILPGEASLNEVAAYLLDYDGFAGVPYTIFADCDHPSSGFSGKVGSLQKYVNHNYESWDLGPNQYSVSEVHRIGILDIRILNVDRHGGNILVQEKEMTNHGESKYKLIPIDHGYSFPDSFESKDLWFEWFNWPQSRKPFDEATLTYISKLDPFGDANLLRMHLGLRDECIRTMIIATSILKIAAKRQMTLYQIAELFLATSSRRRKSFAEIVANRFQPNERFSSASTREYLRKSINDALDVKFHYLSNKDRVKGKSTHTNQQVRFLHQESDTNKHVTSPDSCFKRQKSVPSLLDQYQSESESNHVNTTFVDHTASNYTEYDLSTMSPPSFFPSFLVAHSPTENGKSSPNLSPSTSPCMYANSSRPISITNGAGGHSPMLSSNMYVPRIFSSQT